ncbi:MAG: VacJ family lipoprotein, partial [Alphaproteobacteria bacterium]|nr:VacJ family lipoprotein [Alphaproteobacteria bacterium]
MQQNPSRRGALAAALAWAIGAALLAGFGCATPPDDPAERAAYDEANDPVEPFNRFMFDVSMTLDKTFFRPVAKGYRDVVPDPLRDGVQNFLRNARSPLILINDVLQGEFHRAGVTLQRFALNSTFGFGGIVDLAKLAVGLEFHDEDFGQTLAVWGAGEGFYLFVPLTGPSSLRDVGGGVIDGYMDPASYALREAGITYGPFVRSALTALDERSRNIDTLDDVERTSIDFYAALRSLWRQKREDEIRNGRPAPDRPAPTIAAAAQTQRSPFEEEAEAQDAAAL